MISIVATLYHSAKYIHEFHSRASAAARQLAGDDYEIVLVNDGSPDNSLEVAVNLSNSDTRVVVVDLSRNFGHHKAMMTGLKVARGDRIFLLDSDLEEEPEWLLSFTAQMDALENDVVYGIQQQRKGRSSERLTGWIFYKVFRLLTGIDQPSNITTARLMSRRYVDALLSHQERELNIGGLWIVTGFSQSSQIVKKHATSPTTYSFSRKFSHLVNAVTSFSSLPLVFTFYSGLLISASALVYIVYLVIKYLFIASPPDGYTSIIASIWLFSGLIIFFMGIQGIYISKIFSEVKNRPYTIIRHIYNGASQATSTRKQVDLPSESTTGPQKFLAD
jgi:putative glycosyltransferase